MSEVITKRYYLNGGVQGVWCRDFVVKEATFRGINGWVRNLTDGRVEIVAQATGDVLAELEERLHVGPPLATIEKVESETMTEPTETYFEFKQLKTL